MTRLYYTPPDETYFEELRKACIQLWKEVDTDNDEFGYATEKIDRIKDIKNVGDNFMYMVAMFDIGNQALLARMLSETTKKEIRNRMTDGGQPIEYIVF
jgi:DNA-binding MltR family transcriptional regulator